MNRLTKTTLLIAIVLTVAAPAHAFAAGTTTRTVSTISGMQIAEGLVGQLRGVQLGSTAVTVTLDVAGKPSPVRVDLGDVGTSSDGRRDGWLTLAAIPMAGAALVRLLNFLAKLGGQ